jgi:hypothetical protein
MSKPSLGTPDPGNQSLQAAAILHPNSDSQDLQRLRARAFELGIPAKYATPELLMDAEEKLNRLIASDKRGLFMDRRAAEEYTREINRMNYDAKHKLGAEKVELGLPPEATDVQMVVARKQKHLASLGLLEDATPEQIQARELEKWEERRKKIIDFLGLPQDATQKTLESFRKFLSGRLTGNPSSDWEEIISKDAVRHAAEADRFGLKPDASWAEIRATESEQIRKEHVAFFALPEDATWDEIESFKKTLAPQLGFYPEEAYIENIKGRCAMLAPFFSLPENAIWDQFNLDAIEQLRERLAIQYGLQPASQWWIVEGAIYEEKEKERYHLINEKRRVRDEAKEGPTPGRFSMANIRKLLGMDSSS